jgi:TetR/AcrR family transcriptional regulator, mexJK operon transcriptional repressor
MSEVATRAGISKASLYREHPSKDALLTAVILDWTARGRDAIRPVLGALLSAEDLNSGLMEFAETLQASLLDEEVLQMRRLVVAESVRLPHLATEYLTESWNRNLEALADTLTELGQRGLLEVDNPGAAAEQLTWLIVGAPLNRQTLGAPRLGAADLARTRQDAVNTFLCRFAAHKH